MIRSLRFACCTVLMPAALFSAGCTARSVYDTLRISQERACDQMMGREREECLKRSGMSYDDYQRQLKEQEERR